MTKTKSPYCPHCKKKMIARNGKHGFFFGCSNYPECTFTSKSRFIGGMNNSKPHKDNVLPCDFNTRKG